MLTLTLLAPHVLVLLLLTVYFLLFLLETDLLEYKRLNLLMILIQNKIAFSNMQVYVFSSYYLKYNPSMMAIVLTLIRSEHKTKLHGENSL